MRKINKKGQEEIVGFVLIIILVMVISVVFLGIMLRKEGENSLAKSEELESFLSSVLHYTSDCEIPSNNYLDIGELVTKCDKRDICENNNKGACEVLEKTLESIIKNSPYNVQGGGRIDYYRLDIVSSSRGDKENLIEPIKDSLGGGFEQCGGQMVYNNVSISGRDVKDSSLRLEVCYNS